MFSTRPLDDDLDAVREAHAPGSPVLDVDADFETLPPAAAEDLGLFVDGLSPASFPVEWLPDEVPDLLRKYAGPTFTVGLPGDGTVVRTTQTDPQTVLVKHRAEGTPDDFLAFLIADRLVQIGVEPTPGSLPDDTPSSRLPESFLPFFGERYRDLDAAIRRPDPDTGASTTGLGPTDVFQIATALFDAWIGLYTRDVFASWEGSHPRLFDAWLDAGDSLEGRLGELAGEVARGETDFASATEYACSAVRHGLDLPAPFAALDTAAYRDRGAPYAVTWAEKTVASMVDAAE
ncbi:DUF7089 family protein [Halorubrum lacusprofundi]|jgi:hypothetical protein|uniref:Uncharacterized protein n=1 Tax=Halorubrum lacusprofundi (strain ATCC 49239 / DSM 5036 / JCM 8891 / ACAM 34) TaxID=416348 RepID=B9LUP5_HALLT|nr:hypothetical protein [Halorubrum lacusprofundi]ACM58312.1 conserved hypothetical protein [Halorubrum lacusprofundi ATCC 49239]MCG1006393.1 hypothetical protein [Halorubrum lacusprofundi]